MAKRATTAKKTPKKTPKKKRVSFSEMAGQVVLKGDLKEEKPAPKDPWTPEKQTRRDY